MLIVAIIGGVPAIFAASMALNNPNIKRVLAYSTISQLGYMVLALGAGGFLYYHGHPALGYTAGIFLLMAHAFFKALLFLCSGSVIHAVGTEDMRQMGGLHSKMKITSITMLIGALAISGIPPLSGFWAKDEVLASVFETGEANAIFLFLWLLGVITAFMTAFYMFRLWFMTFTGEKSERSKHAHESPKVMTGPLVALSIFALFSGLVILFGFGEVIYFGHPHHAGAMEVLTEIFGDPLTYISIAVAILGVLLAYLIYYKKSISADIFVSTPGTKRMYKLLRDRYGFTAGYDAFAERVVYGFAKVVDFFDPRGIDGVVNGITTGIVGVGQRLRRVQNGMVQGYATVVVAGIAAILVILYITGVLG